MSINLVAGLKRIRNRNRNVLPRYNVIKKLANNTKTATNFSLWNANGLVTANNNRSQMLYSYIDSTRENIVAITETHLTDNHLSEEILHHFKDYTIHRSDRDTSIGRKTKFG